MSAKLGVVVLAVALAASGAARASDRVERRVACQDEAKRHIRAPRAVDLDLYRRVVERRQLYVQECMLSGPPERELTGAMSVPLPPKRPARSNAGPEGIAGIPL